MTIGSVHPTVTETQPAPAAAGHTGRAASVTAAFEGGAARSIALGKLLRNHRLNIARLARGADAPAAAAALDAAQEAAARAAEGTGRGRLLCESAGASDVEGACGGPPPSVATPKLMLGLSLT